MDRRLEGKVALVTGAGTGIGEAIAHKFAKEGAAAIVNGLPDNQNRQSCRGNRFFTSDF